METDPTRGQSAVAFIHKLYDVEREAKAMSPRDRKRLRQAHAKPALDAFKAWLDAQALIVLPKSVMGQAMAYSLNQWAALNTYLEDGDLAIDNNPAERAVRGIALGRNYAESPIMLSKRWSSYRSRRLRALLQTITAHNHRLSRN
jgi:hypothetical protein